MKWLVAAACLLASQVRADWGVKDGQVSVVYQGSALSTEQFSEVNSLHLPAQSSLELNFQTINENGGSRAHQTLAVISDEATGLQFTYAPTNVKPNGKAKVTIAHKAIPAALQNAKQLTLSLLVASFGDEKPAQVVVSKDLEIDTPSPAPHPARLQVKPVINHVFRPDPKQVSAPVSTLFSLTAIGLLVVLLLFFSVTGSLAAMPSAFSGAPLGHAGLIGALIAFELVFFKYYRGQSIFDTLGAFAVLSPIAVFSGSRALREVKKRRLAGKF